MRQRLRRDSKIFSIYKDEIIEERHRHRYEVNNKFADAFEKMG